MSPAKTICAMHDLSSVGRSALTAIIPTLSAMGLQTIPAPTAVLSAHTAFPHPVITDLTDYLRRCVSYWQEMHIRFDCIYTGYMSSPGQEQIAQKLMQNAPNAFRLVDPVLGDDGEMYQGLPEAMIPAMRSLCHSADLITPNLTEAALLTNTPCSNHPLTTPALTNLLKRLRALGPKTALVTGVRLENRAVNAWMDETNTLHTCEYERVPASFPGTGDLFAAVLAGAMTRGDSLESAVRLASDFVSAAMRNTMECQTPPNLGVQLEKTLEMLIPKGGQS